MRSADARTAFERFLQAEGTSADLRFPQQGLELALQFYATVRADDCELSADGDMLLCQWGTYDRGAGLQFSFNVTRQFIPGLTRSKPMEYDPPILQLSWTFFFEPTPQLRQVGAGNRWCHNPESLGAFEGYIRSLPVFAALTGKQASAVQLAYDDVE
jgi:hypothetical protein